MDALLRRHGGEARGARHIDEQHTRGQQRETSCACDDQRLECGCSSGGPLVFEADEQERREAGELPEHEQRENVVAEDDAEHRSHEREQ